MVLLLTKNKTWLTIVNRSDTMVNDEDGSRSEGLAVYQVLDKGDTMEKKKWKAIDIAYVGMFIALITVCSWINVPLAVPVTLQTFAVFAAVAMLGMERGTVAVVLYVVLGAIGLPVFAGFTGGLGVVLGSTGGYILGFIFTALLSGFIMKKYGKKLSVMIVAMILGLLVCYLFGTGWFMYVYSRNTGAIGLLTTLGWCVFPFVIPDLCKIALAIVLDRRLSRFIK